MPIAINGSGTITGLSAGGLPNGSVTNADLEYTGTSGQVLTSGGAGVAPTWSAASSGLGSGQTWTNVIASRATGTTYTNSTGRSIFVVVSPTASANLIGTFNINGSAVGFVQFTPSGGGGGSPFFYVVPNSATYSVTNNANFAIGYWWELR